MASLNEIGTKVTCPCGEDVPVSLTVGESRREAHGVVLPLSFDRDKLVADFEAHVLASPDAPGHEAFVVSGGP